MLRTIGRWRERRRLFTASTEQEAHALLNAKGRAGALFDLAERLRAIGLDRQERRRIVAVMDAVQRMSPRPPKGDLATRMLYTE